MANNAIAEPTPAVRLKLYRKTKGGGKHEEIFEHELSALPQATRTPASSCATFTSAGRLGRRARSVTREFRASALNQPAPDLVAGVPVRHVVFDVLRHASR